MKEDITPSVKLCYQVNVLLSSLVFANQGKNFMVIRSQAFLKTLLVYSELKWI